MIAVETLGSKQVYMNPWMAVREDAIRCSDGSTGIYGVVDSPDIALIIPVDGDRLHLVDGSGGELPAPAGDRVPVLLDGAPGRRRRTVPARLEAALADGGLDQPVHVSPRPTVAMPACAGCSTT